MAQFATYISRGLCNPRLIVPHTNGSIVASHCWRDHVSQMLTRFTTRATFFLFWAQKKMFSCVRVRLRFVRALASFTILSGLHEIFDAILNRKKERKRPYLLRKILLTNTVLAVQFFVRNVPCPTLITEALSLSSQYIRDTSILVVYRIY